jgi:D-proline reductase (dithiol) PrdB
MQSWLKSGRGWRGTRPEVVEDAMTVDSFRFLPRILAAFYQMTDQEPTFPIPWTRLPRPLTECRFGLVTSGGLYHRGTDQPFDLDRERAEPTWGDPTFRAIPADIQQEEIAISHLHLNTQNVLEDLNILLPIHRFHELAADGRIGGLARHAYSFMGYQGFPPDTTAWQETYGPEVATFLKDEEVDCVLLTPA